MSFVSLTLEINHFSLFLPPNLVSSYRLVVSGADRDGEGLSTQCECSIKVKDVNDNFPTLRESQVCLSFLENNLKLQL